MPRHHGHETFTSRSDFQANREVRRGVHHEPLGVSRPVSAESSEDLLMAVSQLDEMVRRDAKQNPIFSKEQRRAMEIMVNAEVFYEPIEIRNSFDLTLIQKHKVQRRLRGFKGGYELNKAIGNIEHETAASADKEFDMEIERVTWLGRDERTLAVILRPEPIISKEHGRILQVLAKLGLNGGIDPEYGFRQHISLGEEPRDLQRSHDRLRFDHKREIAQSVEDNLPATIALGRLAISGGADVLGMPQQEDDQDLTYLFEQNRRLAV